MQAAKAVDGGLDSCDRRFLFGGIADLQENTVLRKSGSGFLQLRFLDIEHHDTGAFIEKPAGGRQAYPGSRACDQYGLVLETVHSFSFCKTHRGRPKAPDRLTGICRRRYHNHKNPDFPGWQASPDARPCLGTMTSR
jgi:hypothetical protein